jgi:hypothetical protein
MVIIEAVRENYKRKNGSNPFPYLKTALAVLSL